MKRTAIVGALALVLGGCSQTSGDVTAATPAGMPAARAGQQKVAMQKRGSCEDAIQAQTNAAMLGGALGMMGGFGGLAGRGGAVAGQVASSVGSMVASSQSAKARAGVMQECS
jgi:hypothetical protein